MQFDTDISATWMAHKLLPLCLGSKVRQFVLEHKSLDPRPFSGIISWFHGSLIIRSQYHTIFHKSNLKVIVVICCLCSNTFLQLRIAKSPTTTFSPSLWHRVSRLATARLTRSLFSSWHAGWEVLTSPSGDVHIVNLWFILWIQQIYTRTKYLNIEDLLKTQNYNTKTWIHWIYIYIHISLQHQIQHKLKKNDVNLMYITYNTLFCYGFVGMGRNIKQTTPLPHWCLWSHWPWWLPNFAWRHSLRRCWDWWSLVRYG